MWCIFIIHRENTIAPTVAWMFWPLRATFLCTFACPTLPCFQCLGFPELMYVSGHAHSNKTHCFYYLAPEDWSFWLNLHSFPIHSNLHFSVSVRCGAGTWLQQWVGLTKLLWSVKSFAANYLQGFNIMLITPSMTRVLRGRSLLLYLPVLHSH